MLEPVLNPQTFNSLAGHITQSWEWGQFRSQTPTVKKVLRLQSGNKVFQIFFHRLPLPALYLHLPAKYLLIPDCIAYLPRSPFPNREELEEIKKLCRQEKAIFIKIESINQLTNSLINYPHGDPILPQHTIYIDLTKSEDELLAGMHEKTRYNIRLAQKKGVVVKEENTDEGLEKFIKILEATEKRQGFYSHTPDYYRTLWRTLHPANMIHILSAYLPSNVHLQPQSSTLYHPSSPIASIMLFHFKDMLYYPYGGSNPEFREFMAPQLLHWEAIKLGKKLGAKTYDLWGSYKNSRSESDPWWGIYRLKSGFGGQEIDFPNTIDIPLSPLYPLFIFANSIRWTLLKIRG